MYCGGGILNREAASIAPYGQYKLIIKKIYIICAVVVGHLQNNCTLV